MGSVAYGLGQIGTEIAGARELQRKDQIEKIKLALEQQRVSNDTATVGQGQQRLGLEASRDAQMKQYRDAQIALMAKKLNQSPAVVQKIKDTESALGRPLTDAEKLVTLGIKTPHLPETEYQKIIGQLQADHEMFAKYPDLAKILHPPRKEAGAGSEVPEKTLKALADKWQNDGIKPPAKNQKDVEVYMEDHKMSPKIQLTAQEKQLRDIVKQIEPKVDQLQKIIEDNKLTDNGGLGSALGQRYQFYKYKAGVKPDKVHSDLIKAAAALQVMGAGPWMRIGRGKYMFDTITQHLPAPTDSPSLLYDKAQFLKGIIDEAKQAMPDSQGAWTADHPQQDSAPPPGAVIHDFSKE